MDPDDYHALVIPGGSTPEYIRLNERVIEIVRSFAAAAKPIAAIRHGQQVLIAAGVKEGRLCTAYPAVKPDILRAGGTWGEVNKTFSNAHVDGNLVTGPAWPAHPQWIRKFLEVLGSTIIP